ncbi:C-reactive protein-like [Diretmus argenteus]
MEKFLLLMVMFATCCAVHQDLSGKVFIFPKETERAHVKLLTSKTEFKSVTVCLRFFTDLSRTYGLFSLATPGHSNDLTLMKINSDVIRVHARNGVNDFLGLSFPRNTWHSMCVTWGSESGLAQLWVDGKPTVKRFIHSGQPISGAPITTLGQEQDSYGGAFSAQQSFLGMLSEVHTWDYILSGCEIRRYMEDYNFTPGNVFNWRALEFNITGQVLVEDKQECSD